MVSCPRLATVARGVFPCPHLATNASADSRLRLQLCRLCRLASAQLTVFPNSVLCTQLTRNGPRYIAWDQPSKKTLPRKRPQRKHGFQQFAYCCAGGGFPTSPPPRGDCCLGVETCREADVATGACSLGRWGLWRCGRMCCGWRCVGRGVKSGAPAVGLVQHVGWLDPVGRHGDGLPRIRSCSVFALRERTW
jgi:hypothetical protein